MIRRFLRPWGAGIVYATIAALVIGGLGWVTVMSLNVEKANREAQALAERMNQERIALWRLDSQLLPSLSLENNRPFSHYAALNTTYPAVDSQESRLTRSVLRLPSPLLSAELPNWMLLHFQLDAENGWQSPQVLPDGTAEQLRQPPLSLPLTNVTALRSEKLDKLRNDFPTPEILNYLAGHHQLLDEPTKLATDKELKAEEGDALPEPESKRALAEADALQSNKIDRNAFRNPSRAIVVSPAIISKGKREPTENSLEAEQLMRQQLTLRVINENFNAYSDPASPPLMLQIEATAEGYQLRMPSAIPVPDLAQGVPPTTFSRSPSISGSTQDGLSKGDANAMPFTQRARELEKPGELANSQSEKATEDRKQPDLPGFAGVARPAAPAMADKKLEAEKQAAPAEPLQFGRGAARKDDSTASRDREKLNEKAELGVEGGLAAGFPQQANDFGFGLNLPQRQLAPDLAEGISQDKLLGTPQPMAIHLGPLQPLWLTSPEGINELVLLRVVEVNKQILYQGILLDWEKLEAELKGQISDLLPHAELVPIVDSEAVHPERAMTAIPARLDPGPELELSRVGWTPLRMGLLLAWSAALLALAAVGVGGAALVDLSERRIRFVSAVTHELRTPLTSLRLYLDLLASGMVNDEQKRQQYLNTLNQESDRLNRLIENVLDFARLERRAVQAQISAVPVGQLLAELKETWSERLHQDGRELIVIDTTPPGQAVLTDPRMAAQVVGNLIDNARKYTRTATDTRIWLWAKPAGKNKLTIEVEDRGPGIPNRDKASLFRPFRRGLSADTQAGGAGLGLALARQWAEAIGGRLDYRPAHGNVGACFVLELPVATNG